MEVVMPVEFDGSGHDGTLEIKKVIPAAAEGKFSARAIDYGVDGGVAAKAHQRVVWQTIVGKVLRRALIVDLGENGAGGSRGVVAADVEIQTGSGKDDDLGFPLHEEITRDIQGRVAPDQHDVCCF